MEEENSILKTSKDNRIIISNYGITGEILPDRRFLVRHPYWDEAFPSYAHFCRKYGMSPICLNERNEIYGKNIFVFNTIDKEIELTSNFAISLAKWQMSATYTTIFYFEALRHSLCSIVKAYMETASEFSRVLSIPSGRQLQEKDSFLPNSKLPIKWVQSIPISKINATMLNSSNSDSIFYEMMAYLTSARSLLDSLVRILKLRPSISLPKAVRKNPSFHKLINNIEKCKMPDNLKDSIIKSWVWAKNLVEYRDCLLHYSILSKSSLPAVMVIHSENRVVAIFVWLPDNPQVRKAKDFKFDIHLDYLGYAHETYLKLFDLCFYMLKDTLSEVRNK